MKLSLKAGYVVCEELKETVEQVLMGGIQEDSHRAVDVIAAESIDAQHKHCYAREGVFVEPSFPIQNLASNMSPRRYAHVSAAQ